MNLIEKLLRKSPRNAGRDKSLRANLREYLINQQSVFVGDIGANIFTDFFCDLLCYVFCSCFRIGDQSPERQL